MWVYILQAIGLGFAAAAQPGPLQSYLISQSLAQGWRRTLPAAFAPLISDGPIIALSLLLLSQVPSWAQRVLSIAGGLFVLYLAYGALKAWKDFDENLQRAGTGSPRSLLKAALVNTLNPNPYLYWSLVTGPILLVGWREAPAYAVGFLAGFYAAMILSFAAIVVVFGLARQLGPRLNRLLLGISAIALLLFGLLQLWLGFRI